MKKLPWSSMTRGLVKNFFLLSSASPMTTVETSKTRHSAKRLPRFMESSSFRYGCERWVAMSHVGMSDERCQIQLSNNPMTIVGHLYAAVSGRFYLRTAVHSPFFRIVHPDSTI